MNQSTTASTAWLKWVLAVGLLAAVACIVFWNRNATTEGDANAQYFLETEPAGAVDVLALRSDVRDRDDVVVVGRIGGRVNPWVKGTAVFPIVDRSLTPCSEMEGDTCATPWDYCCESNLSDATALVMFVDTDGNAIKQDPRELLHVKELQTVTVQGKAKRDEAGNVTVLATKLHIHDPQPSTLNHERQNER
jgi:hypothetical protein